MVKQLKNLNKIFLLLFMSFFLFSDTYFMKESDLDENDPKRMKLEESGDSDEKNFTPSKITLFNALPQAMSVAWYYENVSEKKMERVGDVKLLESFKEYEISCPVVSSGVSSWRILTKAIQKTKTALGGWNVGLDRQIIIGAPEALTASISFEDLSNNKKILVAKSFKNSNWIEWSRRGIFHIMMVQNEKNEGRVDVVSGGFFRLTNFHFLDVYLRVYDEKTKQFFGNVMTIHPISSENAPLIPVPSGFNRNRCFVYSTNESFLERFPLQKEGVFTESIPYQYLTLKSPEQNKVECTYSIQYDYDHDKLLVVRSTLDMLQESEKRVETAKEELYIAQLSKDEGVYAQKYYNLGIAELNLVVCELDFASKQKNPDQKRIKDLESKKYPLTQEIMYRGAIFKKFQAEKNGDKLLAKKFDYESDYHRLNKEIILTERALKNPQENENQELVSELQEKFKKLRIEVKEVEVAIKKIEKEIEQQKEKDLSDKEDNEDND